MQQGTGRTICGGVGIGKAVVLRARKTGARPMRGVAVEKLAFDDAKAQADRSLALLATQTRQALGDDAADILEMQRLMLDDADYTASVYAAIDRGHTAAEAALSCGEALSETLLKTGDEAVAARAADVRDAARRVYEVLCEDVFLPPDEPFVLMVEELLPSVLLSLPRGFLRGILAVRGTAIDHAAILAKGLGVPYLVGCALPFEDVDGVLCAIDAQNGVWYSDPDDATRRELEEKAAKQAAAQATERTLVGVTKRGRRVRVEATVASCEEVHRAAAFDADGIGLFRSEWLYLGRDVPPDEDTLYRIYREAAQAMGGKPVVIRAPDVGADKMPSYAATDEKNPALGVRGVRWCLRHPDWFDAHIRAVLRAAAHGKVRWLVPMVTTLDEWQAVTQRVAQVKEGLQKDGVPSGDVAMGVMIETPAAALTAAAFCEAASFVRVGANDLTQYVMAADRQNAAVETLCDPRHAAVQRLFREVADAAAQSGIEAGVCGELAADTAWAEPLIAMGYTALSVPPDCVAAVRRAVCESEG